MGDFLTLRSSVLFLRFNDLRFLGTSHMILGIHSSLFLVPFGLSGAGFSLPLGCALGSTLLNLLFPPSNAPEKKGGCQGERKGIH
jgi:hypothetical protein